MIRKFTLKNASGVTWDLNSLDSFYEQIDGMGFAYDFDFETVSNVFLEIKSEIEQPKPSGVIKFSSYLIYNNFVKFTQKTPLTLSYEVPGISDPFYISVKIEEIEKKELEGGCLQCDVSFIGLSCFYKIILKQSDPDVGSGKTYNYTYPYTYTNSASGTVTLDSDTSLDSGCKITIMGPCVNPSWSHFVNGTYVANGKITRSLSEGERFIIDTTKVPYSIKKYDAFMNVIEDCYKYSDFSTKRFILLENGENKIGFTHEGATALNVIVEGWLNYESV